MSCNVIDIHSHLAYISLMIYCICNNINTRDVDEAAKKGAETAQCVQKACGSDFNCGQCKADIDARLRAWHSAHEPVLTAAQ